MRSSALLLIIALAGCSRAVQRPDGNTGLLPVGAVAPDVVGADVAHTEVRLSALKGRTAVVFFYPKDGTPGCTKEVCGFREAWKRFQDANIGVIGVSADSAARHQEWLEKERLPFALASDESGATALNYGVRTKLFGYERVTFLVGPDGRVAHVWPAVDPAQHFDEVLVAAAELAKK